MFRKCLPTQYTLYVRNFHGLKQMILKVNQQRIMQKAATPVQTKVDMCIKNNLDETSEVCHSSKSNKHINKNLQKIIKRLQNSVAEKVFTKRHAIYGAAGLSWKASDPIIVEPIPDPPPIPDPSTISDITEQLNALGEPTLESLGLGGWSPVGLVQCALEYLHVTLDIPWWQAIALGTLIVRFCMFPIVILSQRNAARMNNYLPQLQTIQLKMTQARQSGNHIEGARYAQELMLFMKEKNVNPLKNMIVPFVQMPFFISFFMGLRSMTNLPVDSLRGGGIYWFTDLTGPDQFYILPIITSLTMWITIEIGTDAAKLSSQNLQAMKYVFRALPVMILPFTVNFPGAILCYWVSSNFISLAQVGFLRIPAVRDYFKIERLITHDPQTLPVKSKGFVASVKDAWTNIKITKDLEERSRFDSMQFQHAGRGPIVKTYKYDPTKQVQNNPATVISAKKR